MDHVFTLAGATLHARADGALWWPDERLLCVSDLHLGKSERMARGGGALLPPYESRETLWRLAEAIAATDPVCVICLGDSFDDLAAAQALKDDTRQHLAKLQAGRDWVWIEGNHDAGPVDLAGSHRKQVRLGALTFRHVAQQEAEGEVSGHFHPKAGVAGIAQRPCFLLDERRLILPAFGAYTGGLSARATPLAGLMGDRALAILTGKRAIPVPLAGCTTR